MAGADWYWKSLTDAQRGEFRGMVDLDHLGRTIPGFSTTSSGAAMARLLPAAARALQISPEPQSFSDTPESDAAFFQRAHVPAITIYSRGYISEGPAVDERPASVTSQLPGDIRKVPPNVPHSFALKTNLDPDLYNQTYNLLCVYVLFLDRGLGASKRAAPEVQMAKSAPPEPTKPAETPSAPPAAAHAPPADTAPVITAANSAAAPPKEPTPVSAQTPSPSSGPFPAGPASATIHVNARLVQFDVVVTDNQGRPVKDLTAADFTVLQDGKPQAIRAFELHTPASTEQMAAAGAGRAQPAVAVSTANTLHQYSGQSPAEQLDDYSLRSAEHGGFRPGLRAQPAAATAEVCSARSTGGVVRAYAAARDAAGIHPGPRPACCAWRSCWFREIAELDHHGRARANHQHHRQLRRSRRRRRLPLPPVRRDSAPTRSPTARPRESRRATTIMRPFAAADRALFTLEAMEGLARSVSGYPGRKNLIWLSGSFPGADRARPCFDRPVP